MKVMNLGTRTMKQMKISKVLLEIKSLSNKKVVMTSFRIKNSSVKMKMRRLRRRSKSNSRKLAHPKPTYCPASTVSMNWRNPSWPRNNKRREIGMDKPSMIQYRKFCLTLSKYTSKESNSIAETPSYSGLMDTLISWAAIMLCIQVATLTLRKWNGSLRRPRICCKSAATKHRLSKTLCLMSTICFSSQIRTKSIYSISKRWPSPKRRLRLNKQSYSHTITSSRYFQTS